MFAKRSIPRSRLVGVTSRPLNRGAVFLAALGSALALGADKPGRRRRRHAPSQRLAHRAGRAARHGRRSAARHGGVAGRPLPDRQQQRLREADADGGRRRVPRCRARRRSSTRGSAWPGIRTASASSHPAARTRTVRELRWEPGRLVPARTFAIGKPVQEGFLGGVAINPDGRAALRRARARQRVSAIDLVSGDGRRRSADLAGRALYLPRLRGRRDALRLALGRREGAHVRSGHARPKGEIPVGEHPNAMVLSKDGARLFVACANTNAVWAVDLATRAASEQISVALSPDAPPGSTPNALALSPDGETLLVANADNNAVAVVDVAGRRRAGSRASSRPAGIRPGVQFSRDGKRIFVLSGKGLTSMPNPRGPQPGGCATPSQYIGAMLKGSLSVLAVPDAASSPATRRRFADHARPAVARPAPAAAAAGLARFRGGRATPRRSDTSST